jgi:hypothetical protein
MDREADQICAEARACEADLAVDLGDGMVMAQCVKDLEAEDLLGQ